MPGEKKLAGVVRRGRSRVFSPSHSVGLSSAVFQRKLAQTVVFNWLLQIQNVYSALHRSSRPLHGRRLRPVQQIADVQGERGGVQSSGMQLVCCRVRKNSRDWKEARRLCESWPAARNSRCGQEALVGCNVCNTRQRFLSCLILTEPAFDKYHRRNQDLLWLNMALCQIHNLNTANRLHRRTSHFQVNGSVCSDV